MKNYTILIAIFVFSINYAQSEDDFIMTYEVNSTTGLGVQYPFFGENFTIDLGDGNTLTNEDLHSGIHHTYSTPGVYTVVVSGDINRVYFDGGSGYLMYDKVKSIEQWGTAQWISMENAFSGLRKLTINATDVPDLSLVTNMESMFMDCLLINSPLNNWDVSNVTNMTRLFRNATSFNQPLDNWDVSNVTNMDELFARAASFNQNINNWDVSNVTSMIDMFGCFPGDYSNFNQPINNWDVSNVTDMYWMFRNAVSFNQPLDSWDVSNVTEFGLMFYNATSFNQNINSWNTSNVLSTESMFEGAISFNEPLNDWDMSNNERFKNMFRYASSFNQPLNNWDTSSANFMRGIFHSASNFNQDISDWNFQNVLDFTNGLTNESFIGYTSMDTDNYDALLLALIHTGFQNKVLLAYDMEYCDTQVRSYLSDQANWWIIGDNLSANCIDYLISGTVFFDNDNNGCDNNDIPVDGFLINATNSDFDYGTFILNGNYSIEANQGEFDLSIVNLPSYFTSNPVSENLTLDNNNSTDVVNFCLTASQSVEDLNITILPLDNARPGFESHYKLVVKNTGTENINDVLVTFNFDDTKQTFSSTTLTATSTTPNSANFSLGTVEIFEKIEFEISMLNLSPPDLNADDIISITGQVMPNSNDFTPNDNIYDLEQIAINSFDPNDKTVLQGETITLDETDEYLDYIIRFQNTGNANASFVRVEDDLDPELDWSTLTIVSSSHDYQVKMVNKSQVEFLFNDINLPYESFDEPNSHGYIAYKIKPKSTVGVGDIMSGNASIYFDYNPPIITNSVSTEVVENLQTDENYLDNALTIYPNPSSGYFKIEISNFINVESINLYDITGKLIREFTESEIYSINDLKPGIYILTVKTNKSIVTKKLIKF